MIGERLAEIRKDHDDTQKELANKLNISLATVRSWEQDKSSPPHDALVNICSLYQVSSDYLLGISDIDPAYIQRRQQRFLSEDDLKELKQYEEYLIWKKRRKN